MKIITKSNTDGHTYVAEATEKAFYDDGLKQKIRNPAIRNDRRTNERVHGDPTYTYVRTHVTVKPVSVCHKK